MGDGDHKDVLLLRDSDGNPFVVPRALLEQEELMPLRLDGEDYLVPRKTLLASAVAGDSEAVAANNGAEHNGAATTFRTPDGVTVSLTAAQLDEARASSPTEKDAVETVLDVEVAAHALDFDIGAPGDRTGPRMLGGRMALKAFIS
jgi:hypothetical protein